MDLTIAYFYSPTSNKNKFAQNLNNSDIAYDTIYNTPPLLKCFFSYKCFLLKNT